MRGERSDGDNRFKGRILRAAVYGRALTAEEITQRARAAEPKPRDGAIGQWEFAAKPGRIIRPAAGTLTLQLARGNPQYPAEFDGEFTGEAPAPEEPLSLWYRRPANGGRSAGHRQWPAWRDGFRRHPARAAPTQRGHALGRRALRPEQPGGAGRVARSAAAGVRGQIQEADQLVSQKMIARPRGQMPYQTVGDLLLTFPRSSSVADYRRELNLDTAIARVSYSAGGVKFTRELFASPVDQVIVVRLTADQPGQIAFTAGMNTPQKAAVTVERPDTLVLRGVNGAANGVDGRAEIPGPRQGERLRRPNQCQDVDQVSVTNADSVTLLIAAATSYKNFKDVSGDPEALTENYSPPPAGSPSRPCARPTSPSTSACSAAWSWTSARPTR